MVVIIPAPDQPYGDVAKLLLKLAGPQREREIETGTLPARFEVPDDIGAAYEQLLTRRATPAAIVRAAVQELVQATAKAQADLEEGRQQNEPQQPVQPVQEPVQEPVQSVQEPVQSVRPVRVVQSPIKPVKATPKRAGEAS